MDLLNEEGMQLVWLSILAVGEIAEHHDIGREFESVHQCTVLLEPDVFGWFLI